MAVICNLICVIAMMLCTYTYSVCGDAAKYYMEDYCTPGSVDSEVFVGEDGVQLYSQRGPVYGSSLDCKVTLYTHDKYNLTLRSQMIVLERVFDCIQLNDGKNSLEASPRRCSNEPLAYTTTQNYLTILFTTDSSTHNAGFRLLVTQQIPGQNIPCYTGYGDFQCLDRYGCFDERNRCNSYSSCTDQTDDRNCDRCDDDGSFLCESSRQCLSTYKVCDGNQDCDNGEDETQPECYPSIWLYWNAGQLAGIFISYVIFLVIVIVIVAVVHKKCKK